MRVNNLMRLGMFVAVLSVPVVVAQPGDQGTRRIPQFENEHVRVWKTVIMPNQPLSMHRHDHPRALIALVGGEIRIVQDNGDSKTHVWETGQAYWLEADPPEELHADVNETDRPIEVMVVELKQAR